MVRAETFLVTIPKVKMSEINEPALGSLSEFFQ